MNETTTDAVSTALAMFPDAVIYPNAGCHRCTACQLLTRNGETVITVHAGNCPTAADL